MNAIVKGASLCNLFGKGLFVVTLVGLSMLVYGVFRVVMAFEFRRIGKILDN